MTPADRTGRIPGATAGEPVRFRDTGATWISFTDEIWVRCPRCAGRATVLPSPTDVRAAAAFRARRLICPCGHRAEGPPGTLARQPSAAAQELDPRLGLSLWLRADCAGHVPWAYNPRHLSYLRAYVAADLRTDQYGPDISTYCGATPAHRLPAWMKQAGHRTRVLRTIDRIAAARCASEPPQGTRGTSRPAPTCPRFHDRAPRRERLADGPTGPRSGAQGARGARGRRADGGHAPAAAL